MTLNELEQMESAEAETIEQQERAYVAWAAGKTDVHPLLGNLGPRWIVPQDSHMEKLDRLEELQRQVIEAGKRGALTVTERGTIYGVLSRALSNLLDSE